MVIEGTRRSDLGFAAQRFEALRQPWRGPLQRRIGAAALGSVGHPRHQLRDNLSVAGTNCGFNPPAPLLLTAKAKCVTRPKAAALGPPVRHPLQVGLSQAELACGF